MRRLCLLVALAGCGDNLPDPGAARSGSRLHVVRATFDGGASLPDRAWLFDAARAERCTPAQWSDGFRYCTPAAAEPVYADAGCSVSIALDADYVVRRSPINGFIARLAPRGSERAAGPHWILEGDECTGPIDPAPGEHEFDLGAELGSDAFARVRRQELGSDRLELVAETGDDGLWLPAAIHDRLLDDDCDDAVTSACAPRSAAPTGYFHDAACTVPVVSATEVPPAARADDTGCRVYRAIGDDVTGQALFVAAGDACLQMPAPTGQRQFLATEALDLAPIAVTLEPRDARIAGEELAVAGTALLATAAFDRTLHAECAPSAGRCLPTRTAELHPAFADAQCVVPRDVALVLAVSCAPAPAFARGLAGELHAITDPVTAPLYEISTGDRCVPYTPPAGYVAHAVDPALPPEAFAAVTVVTD